MRNVNRLAIAGMALLGLLATGCGGRDEEKQATGAVLSAAPQPGSALPGKEWDRIERPELLGWSPERLASARAYSKEIGSAAVMIVQDGVVVDAWGEVAARHNMRSARKSLLNALIGTAVSEGRIDLDATLADLGVDDRERLTESERRARVRDLLSSTSGVYHPAAFETPSNIRLRPPRGSHAPGKFFYYNNWDFNALGSIYERGTGERIFEAFQRRVAGPLGMQDYDLEANSYRLEDSSDHPAYLFRISARDLARFGLLYLRGGRWGDRQVLPADWVVESLKVHAPQEGDGLGYGYLWWVEPSSETAAAGAPDAYALGAGGQTLLVSPRRRLVVAHVSKTEPLLMLRFKLGWTPTDDEAWSLLDRILEAAPPSLTGHRRS